MKKFAVVGKTRLSTDSNKVPYEDIVKKSAAYFESDNKELILKGALLFNSIASAEKELALTKENAKSEIKCLEMELVHVNKELLQSKQAVTSRGILEHFLKGSQIELGLKGNFNAAAVCEALKKHKVIVLYAMLLIGFSNIPNLHFRKVEY